MIYIYECYFYGKIKNPNIVHYLAVENEWIIYENKPHAGKKYFISQIVNKTYKNNYKFRFKNNKAFDESIYSNYGEFNKYKLEDFLNKYANELL